MQFIDKIETIDELKAFKKQLGKTIERKLGSPLGERKLNEATADFLGVRDYNTAMGIISLRKDTKRDVDFFEKATTSMTKPKKDKAQATPLMVRVWVFLFNQLVANNVVNDEEIQIILDDFIFDFFGSSPKISDDINNQGWAAQIEAVINSGYIHEFMREFSVGSELGHESLGNALAKSLSFLENNQNQDEHEEKRILDLSDI